MFIQLAAFINLFCVPVLSIHLFYRKRNRPLTPSLELLSQYCIAVSFNYALTKLILMLPTRIFDLAVSVDSAHYTVAALCCAWLLPELYDFSKNIQVELQVSKADEPAGNPKVKTARKKDVSRKHETKQQ